MGTCLETVRPRLLRAAAVVWTTPSVWTQSGRGWRRVCHWEGVTWWVWLDWRWVCHWEGVGVAWVEAGMSLGRCGLAGGRYVIERVWLG